MNGLLAQSGYGNLKLSSRPTSVLKSNQNVAVSVNVLNSAMSSGSTLSRSNSMETLMRRPFAP